MYVSYKTKGFVELVVMRQMFGQEMRVNSLDGKGEKYLMENGNLLCIYFAIIYCRKTIKLKIKIQ